MRTCRSRGIRMVAAYSEADQDMFYLREVGETHCIGSAKPIKSYLDMETVIAILMSDQYASGDVHTGSA